ncbi:Deoxyribose-phosphate aldolase [Carabus blaptoides fortunei]
MIDRNPGCELDLGWINKVNVNFSAVNEHAASFQQSRPLKDEYQAAWLLRALTCIDLTTLGGDDTDSNVSRLCYKAAKPLPSDVLLALGFNYDDILQPIRTAAVCVYPSKVDVAVATLKKIGLYHKINVASVATGFPSGQMPLRTRLDEIKYAVEMGATEIDIVIDRSLVLTAQWEKLYQEIQQMKEACGQNAHMKTILAVGELGNLNNVYKASLVAMMAGSDFIKTSTGKESLNATIPFGIVMCRAIREYQRKAGYKVGLKPAGGIRTAKDALAWLVLVREELGKDWCYPDLFRIGASGLLGDIERQLFHYTTKTYAALHEFNMA